MIRREPWMPPLFTVLSCGIYYLYWQYVTTEELKAVSGREDLNPLVDLLLTACCCGVWGIYVQYRNAEVVHQALQARGVGVDSKGTFVLILHGISLAVGGLAGLFAIAVLQEEYNRLADLPPGGGAGVFGSPPQTF